MLVALLHFLYELYLVAGGPAAEAVEGVGAQVDFAAGLVVLMEGAADVVAPAYFDLVMRQNVGYGKALLDVGDLHLKKSLINTKNTL
jgi:hypothetical protein